MTWPWGSVEPAERGGVLQPCGVHDGVDLTNFGFADLDHGLTA